MIKLLQSCDRARLTQSGILAIALDAVSVELPWYPHWTQVFYLVEQFQQALGGQIQSSSTFGKMGRYIFAAVGLCAFR